MKNQRIKNKYIAAKNEFKNQRLFFNKKVEEKMLEEKKEEPLKSIGYDSYDNAKFLIENYPEIVIICTKVREENPKFETKTIKKIIIDSHNESPQSHLDNYFYGYSFASLVDSYFLYESCGFAQVVQKEKELRKIMMEIENIIKNFRNSSKTTIMKIGKTTQKIVKPYRTIAKKQAKEVYNVTKSVVHKKSKKLVKTFQRIADETATNN